MTETIAKIEKSDEEWRRELSPEQFHVCRQKGTERPFSGTLNDNKAAGTYRCVCCGQDLFRSADKFDSGTGWPSFTAPASAESVRFETDRNFFMRRTEVLCARCDSHLGHVFPDGPEPTGQRFCMNSVALDFEPEE